jgi:hypothetical protein
MMMVVSKSDVRSVTTGSPNSPNTRRQKATESLLLANSVARHVVTQH